LGTPTQQVPLYIRYATHGNQKLNGIKTDLVKWEKQICSECNNSVSAPYYKSWEKLSNHLQMVPRGLSEINFALLYGQSYKEELLNLHLYFLKQIGCYIASSGIKLDLSLFNRSLLDGEEHPNFYLRISYYRNWPIEKKICLTEMLVAEDNSGPCIAIASYGIGAWCIDMTYWHPRAEPPPIISISHQPSKARRVIPVNYEDADS